MSLEKKVGGQNENLTLIAEQEITNAADAAYAEIAESKKESPETVFASRLCESVNESLIEKLTALGIKAKKQHYAGWDITDHFFVLATLNGEDYVIDPTWQQFLTEPDPGRPKVLMIRISELGTELAGLGVPIDKHHIWLEALDKKTA